MNIVEQEDFMHLIYDIAHIGVSPFSMTLKLEFLADRYEASEIKKILNSELKDEKYSDNFVLPMKKCIYQYNNMMSDDKFFSNKLELMKILNESGASINFLTIDQLNELFREKLINKEIMNYIIGMANNSC